DLLEHVAWQAEGWEGLGATFASARFYAAGPGWNDDERGKLIAWLGGGEPAEGVHEADSVWGHALSLGSFQHGHPNEVVNQQKHRQLLLDSLDRLAPQDIHLHGRFDVAQAGFNRPSQPIGLGQFVFRIAHGI